MVKLNESDMERVTGGQNLVENVMGVKGLSACTGAPTTKNKEGVFWSRNGVSITKEKAIKLLENESTYSLDVSDPNEAFLADFISEYNKQVDGDPL